jgi:hypothetical protein
MLNVDVLARLEALIAYCDAQGDWADWQTLSRILTAVRGAAGYWPELQGLHEHLRPYVAERLQRLLEEQRQGLPEACVCCGAPDWRACACTNVACPHCDQCTGHCRCRH